jgi:TolA-binding protein
MNTFQHSLLSALLLPPALLLGCATGTSYLEMSRIAGYVGASPGKIYVERIGGEDSSKFRDHLYKALSDDGRFATERYGVVPSDTPDSAATTPALILSGTYSTDRDSRTFTEGSGENEKKYKETTKIYQFRYLIRDACTGEELDANVARYEDVKKELDRGESFLEAIIGNAVQGAFDNLVGIESGNREALARMFVTSLHLHRERRGVGLLQDKEIPELEEGIGLVRNGDLSAAIVKFQAGAENHPNSKSLHKAYFNLGVAFEYNREFDRALVSLRLADELAPQENYAPEIDYCQWFARQHRWQARYGGPYYELP